MLVYISAWVKCYYPDVFTTALLNSYPMGFYAPAQLVSDARKHGIDVRPIDVNHSGWDCTMEKAWRTLRVCGLGFCRGKGLREDQMAILTAQRGTGYKDASDLWHRGVPQAALETLANISAFRSIGLDRRKAIWEVAGLADRPAPLFAGQANDALEEAAVSLLEMTKGEEVLLDYKTMALSLTGHPVEFVRSQLAEKRVLSVRQLAGIKEGKVKVSGLIIIRQRPGTGKGVCFGTIEDETGLANIVIFKKLFEKHRKEILHAKLWGVEGILERDEGVTHIIANKLHDFTDLLRVMSDDGSNLPLLIPRADEIKYGPSGSNRGAQAIPTARNFR